MKKSINKIITLTTLSVALASTIASAATYSGSYNWQIGTQFSKTAVVAPYTRFSISPTSGEGIYSAYYGSTLVFNSVTSNNSTWIPNPYVGYNFTFKASAHSTSAYGSATLIVE